MKYLILSLLVIVAGCDTPTRSRFPSTSIGNQQIADPFTSGPGMGAVSPTTPTTPTTPSPGFENCNLSKSRSTADLGSVGICRSSQNETQVRFVTSSSNTSSRTCLIPLHRDSQNRSVYLGDPQCTYTEAEKVYTGQLYKHSSKSSLMMNGVAIMLDHVLTDYFACKDAYVKYIQYYCPGNPTYAPCVQGANNYSNSMCGLLVTKYPNNFLEVIF